MLGSCRPFPAGRSWASFAVSSSRLSSSFPWRRCRGAGSVPPPSPPRCPLCPPATTYRELLLATLLHRAGPPAPRPSLPEQGELGGSPPRPGAGEGPLCRQRAVPGVLRRPRQPGELQLQDTCGESQGRSHPRVLLMARGCSLSPVGAPPTPPGDAGASPRKSSAEKVSLSHTWRMSLGGTFSTVSSRFQECSCRGGEGEKAGVMLVPCVSPPLPSAPGRPSPCGAGRRAARLPGSRRRRRSAS